MATPRRVSAVNIVNWLLELAVENPVNADVADEDAASPPIFLQQDLSQGRGLSTEDNSFGRNLFQKAHFFTLNPLRVLV